MVSNKGWLKKALVSLVFLKLSIDEDLHLCVSFLLMKKQRIQSFEKILILMVKDGMLLGVQIVLSNLGLLFLHLDRI